MKPELNFIDDYECGVNEKTRHDYDNDDSQQHEIVEHHPRRDFHKQACRKEL